MKLIILDIDETLLHASDVPVENSTSIGPFHVVLRPHLKEFLNFLFNNFKVAIWTSGSENYMEHVLDLILPKESPLEFSWSSHRCTWKFDPLLNERVALKKLSKVKRLGFSLDSILAIDDTPAKYQNNYGNLIRVREFLGDHDDNELLHLIEYLKTLSGVDDVRNIEKRNWRDQ